MNPDDQDVEYLSQGVDYLGFLKQQLGDLRGIATLAHELIQNADDAKDASGALAATRITFDVRDDALVVHNDAAFREEDFDRLRNVAAGTKRTEGGARTTGAFGVGFISVYQVTDRPEVVSSGRHWILSPDEPEARRIASRTDSAVTPDRGTTFRLPWAFKKSPVRERLGVPPISAESLDQFVQELREALPRAIIFLKAVSTIALQRSGKVILTAKRTPIGDEVRVEYDGTTIIWRVLRGDFSADAKRLRASYGPYIEENRHYSVRVAVPTTPLDAGLLFATLPTEERTGLPFHIDADFFPDSDRKHIVFGSASDHRSEWNRAAVRAANASVVANLPDLLAMFHGSPATLWLLLSRMRRVHDEAADPLRPFGGAWPDMQTALRMSPVVFSQTGKWRLPADVRLPSVHDSSIAALNAIGIETVHSDLRTHWNILGAIGVRQLAAADFSAALAQLGLVDATASMASLPEPLRSSEGLRQLWQAAVEILDSVAAGATNARLEAANVLAQCSLAPCTDATLRPLRSAFRASQATRMLFDDARLQVPFLLEPESSHPLLENLCPGFTAAEAADALTRLDDTTILTFLGRDQNRAAALIGWFAQHRLEIQTNSALRDQIADLKIFPSGGTYRALRELALPGDFVDPLGLSDLVDLESLPGLRDFLEELGASALTFRDYVARHATRALGSSTLEPAKVRDLCRLIARHIGEIREDQSVRRSLAGMPLVECEDGEFRRATEAYIRSDDTSVMLESNVAFARPPGSATSPLLDLYRWLGVAERPRPEDVVRMAELRASPPPSDSARAAQSRMFEALARIWSGLSDAERERYARLKSLRWLPAEGDRVAWWQPSDLAASFNRTLFESQAKFLDVPMRSQQTAVPLFDYLGIVRAPRPYQVVRHLQKCVDDDVDPPAGIYEWLNNTAQEADIAQLRGIRCLRLGGKYYRASEVFWGDHPFGRFRMRLGESFRNYNRLLSLLGVREAATHVDAIEVLKQIAEERGHNKLESDREIVLECWVMLSDSLTRRETTAADLRLALGEVACVPNQQDLLYPPTWMFFEDRPDLATKFTELLRHNTVRRPERAWIAMQGAGVRPISEVVTGELVEPEDAWEDPALQDRVTARAGLLKAITEALIDEGAGAPGAGIDRLRFVRADALAVGWHLDALGQNRSTEPERVSAFLTATKEAIYFALEDGQYPWRHLARELALALAPGVEVRFLSPGILSVIAADDENEASSQLSDLGIAGFEILAASTRSAAPVDSFDMEVGSQGDSSPEAEQLDGGSETEAAPFDGRVGRNGDQSEEPSAGHEDESAHDSFAEKLYEAQTHRPTGAIDAPVLLPPGGPETDASARQHTEDSFRFGRDGAKTARQVIRWVPREAAAALADEFRRMAHGDYASRCQICGRTFRKRTGGSQAFVLHLVQPQAHRGSNHFGDLVSLCGWHYALVRDGQWAFLDPDTGDPIEGAARLARVVSAASTKTDDEANEYVALAIRFWNVYGDWDAVPQMLDEEIRYSIPHWKYLRALITAEEVSV